MANGGAKIEVYCSGDRILGPFYRANRDGASSHIQSKLNELWENSNRSDNRPISIVISEQYEQNKWAPVETWHANIGDTISSTRKTVHVHPSDIARDAHRLTTAVIELIAARTGKGRYSVEGIVVDKNDLYNRLRNNPTELSRTAEDLAREISEKENLIKPPMNLSSIIEEMKVGQIARATFGRSEWYITMTPAKQIRYCYSKGNVEDLVPLTQSNIQADYEILD